MSGVCLILPHLNSVVMKYKEIKFQMGTSLNSLGRQDFR